MQPPCYALCTPANSSTSWDADWERPIFLADPKLEVAILIIPDKHNEMVQKELDARCFRGFLEWTAVSEFLGIRTPISEAEVKDARVIVFYGADVKTRAFKQLPRTVFDKLSPVEVYGVVGWRTLKKKMRGPSKKVGGSYS